MPHAPPHLLVFGYGYTARRLGAQLRLQGWDVTGTTRSPERAEELAAEGTRGLVFDPAEGPSTEVRDAVRNATHLLDSIPTRGEGDPVLRHLRDEVTEAAGRRLSWMAFLSTTGVYGEHHGAWVDEATPPHPGLERTRLRLAAEEGWAALSAETGVPLQIFRIAGIYGPGQSVLDRLRDGTARRIVKPGSVFNRIHVDDIVGAILAGMVHPEVTGPVNLADDLPAPGDEVLEYACALLGMEPPPAIPFEDAGLSPMGRSFYAEDRRVRNTRLKEALGYALRYPTYREGLTALLEVA